jgi:hypothetical protein
MCITFKTVQSPRRPPRAARSKHHSTPRTMFAATHSAALSAKQCQFNSNTISAKVRPHARRRARANARANGVATLGPLGFRAPIDGCRIRARDAMARRDCRK